MGEELKDECALQHNDSAVLMLYKKRAVCRGHHRYNGLVAAHHLGFGLLARAAAGQIFR